MSNLKVAGYGVFRRGGPRAAAFAVFFGAVILAAGCSRNDAGLETTGGELEQVLEKFTMTDRAEGRNNWSLAAEEARISEDDGVIMLKNARADFYEGDRVSSKVSGRSGRYDRAYDILELWGDVVVDSIRDETVLMTERMFYDTALNRIFSEEKVRVIRRNTVTEGVGFESDPGLNVISIKDNITEIENER